MTRLATTIAALSILAACDKAEPPRDTLAAVAPALDTYRYVYKDGRELVCHGDPARCDPTGR